MTEDEHSSRDMEKFHSSDYHSDQTIIRGSPRQNGMYQPSHNVDRKGGRGHAMLQVIGRLIPSFVFRVKAVYILWLPKENWLPPKVRSGLRWAVVEDAEQITNLVHRIVNVQSRLNWGGRGVIKEKDGNIVGCLWITRESPTYDGWLQVQLSNSEGWIFDVFVSPDHRGEGIAKQMGDLAREDMVKQGVNRVAAVTNVLNLSAFRSSGKSKYQATRIWYLRLLGWTLVRFPGGWHIGWWRRKRPMQVPLSNLIGPQSP